MTEKKEDKIVLYEPSMAENVSKMFNEFNELWPGGFGGALPYTAQRVRDWLDESTAIADFIAINSDGDFCGYCGLCPSWLDKDISYISIIGVTPKAKGKRFGKRLLLKSIEMATEKGIKQIDLHTWSGNLEAVPLYKKVGFFWVPGSNVYMQNFLPMIFQMPLAAEWFTKHPNWYDCFKREFKQTQDKEIIDGMEVYVYAFECEGDSLRVEIDKYGWGISNFERVLNGEKLSIKTKINSHHLHIGFNYAYEVMINNGTGKDIEANIVVNSFEGLEWLNSFPKLVKVKANENSIISNEFTLSKEAKQYSSDHKVSERINSLITIEGKTVDFIVGGKIETPLKIQTLSHYSKIPLKSQSKVYFDLENTTNTVIKGFLDYEIEGMKIKEDRIAFNLDSEEIKGIEIPIEIVSKSLQSIYSVKISAHLSIGESVIELPQFSYSLIPNIDTIELVLDNNKEKLTLITEYWAIFVTLEGGEISFYKETPGGGDMRSYFQIGPPFGIDIDRKLKFDFELKREEKAAVLILSAMSRKVDGVKIQKYIKVSYNSREVEHWIELTNVIETSITVAGKTRFTGGGGFSINSRGIYGSTITPIYNKYVESEPTMPFLSTPFVSQEPKDFNETWTATKLLAEESFLGIIWKPNNIHKIDLSSGLISQIESDAYSLSPNETIEVSHIWIGQYSGMTDVKNRWNQLINQDELVFDEFEFNLKTVKPIEFSLEGDNLCEKGKSITKTVNTFFISTYPLQGLLELILPKSWEGHFVTDNGKTKEIPMPESTPNKPIPLVLELFIPENETKSSVTLTLKFTGEFVLEFTLPLLVYGNTVVSIVEDEIEDHKVITLKNSTFCFSVPKEVGGNMIRLHDSTNKSFFIDNFPKIEPKLFTEFNIGGLAPLIFPVDSENPFLTPETVNTEPAHLGKWSGVKTIWTITQHRKLKGLKSCLYYLTLPDSNIIRVRLEIENSLERKIKLVGIFMGDIMLDNSLDDNAILVPLEQTELLRTRNIPQAFFNINNPKRPWLQFQKGDQSLAFLSPEGEHVTISMFDAQMAIFTFIGSLFELKPKAKKVIEFTLLLNETEKAILEVRKALKVE